MDIPYPRHRGVLRPMPAFRALTEIANERFAHYLAELGGETPAHRVEFSRRITTSWALIYYRRHLVRLSPYLFLLDESELKHGTHWRELDATIRHEAAHAYIFAKTGETGHSDAFHEALARLGVRSNGTCDLGPENAAFRYVYSCGSCETTWPRRQPIRGNVSCGRCAPGRYDAAFRLQRQDLHPPWLRLMGCQSRIDACLREGVAEIARTNPGALDTNPILATALVLG